MVFFADPSWTDTERATPEPDIDKALRTIRSTGLVDVPLDRIAGPVAEWLDELIGRAEEAGLTLTWSTHDQTLRVIDLEA